MAPSRRPGHGKAMSHTRTITHHADTIEELIEAVGTKQIGPGSTIRFTMDGKKILGACPVPLGTLNALPGVAEKWSSELENRGFELTGHNGFEEICDAWITMRVPPDVAVSQGQAPMGFGPVAVGFLLLGLALVLVALGWVVERFHVVITEVLDDVRDALKDPAVWLLIGVALLLVFAPRPQRKRSET